MLVIRVLLQFFLRNVRFLSDLFGQIFGAIRKLLELLLLDHEKAFEDVGLLHLAIIRYCPINILNIKTHIHRIYFTL